jgi:hypothetical protein
MLLTKPLCYYLNFYATGAYFKRTLSHTHSVRCEICMNLNQYICSYTCAYMHTHASVCACACACVRARLMLKIYDGRHGCCGRSISHRCSLLSRFSGHAGRCHEDSSNGRPPRAIVCQPYFSLARLRALTLSLSLALFLSLSHTHIHTNTKPTATLPGCFFLGHVTGKLTSEDVCRH